jgi:hypothetical protein
VECFYEPPSSMKAENFLTCSKAANCTLFCVCCRCRRASAMLLEGAMSRPCSRHQVLAPIRPWGSQLPVRLRHFPREVSRHPQWPSLLEAATSGQCKVKQQSVVNHAWCLGDSFVHNSEFNSFVLKKTGF